MDINSYSIYSKNVGTEKLNNRDFEKVARLIKQFDEIYDIEKAKSYLEETWDISSIVRNHPVGANCILNLKESQSGFEIRFEHDKENTIYFYNN